MTTNIFQGTLLLCSDGSYDPIRRNGSQGWVIAMTEGTILWEGAAPNDGHPQLSSAYPSELGGKKFA